MVRSKKDKVVALTKTKPKGRAGKEALVNNIREALENFDHCFVLDHGGSRATFLKQIRDHFGNDARLFNGKKSLMVVALGADKASSHVPGSYELVPFLSPSALLLFTSLPPKNVAEYFENFSQEEYLAPGEIAPTTFTLPAGPLPVQAFSGTSMVQYLSKLNVPVRLNGGVIHVTDEVRIATAGEVVTPEGGKLLKLLSLPAAAARCTIVGQLSGGVVHRPRKRSASAKTK